MKKISVLWISLLLILSYGLLIPTQSATGGLPPPPDDGIDGLQYIDGDWNVTGIESYTNETIVLTGNLTIEFGGNLTFNNVTLMMNSTVDGEFHIEVQQGGTFTILDLDNDNTTTIDASNITAYDTDFEYLFWVRAGSNFTMKNSELHEVGYTFGFETLGLSLHSDNSKVEGVIITDGFMGIFINQSSPTITNNTIENNEYWGIYIYNQSSPVISNNIVRNNVDDGIYIRKLSSPTINNNLIVGNGEDGINIREDSHPIIENNIINDHPTSVGIYIEFDSNPYIANNTINNSYDGINVMFNSNPMIVNNTIRNSDEDGVYILGATATIMNTSIYDSGFGVVVATNSNLILTNSTILNTTSNDLYIAADSHLTSLNSSFNVTDVKFGDALSNLTVRWFLHTYVNDTFDNPISGATVRVRDNANNTFDNNYTTGADGWARWMVVTERVQNISGNVSYTPHNITVSKSGYLDGYAIPEQNMNESRTVVITLQVPDTSEPTINHSAPTTASINEEIEIVANVTDDFEVANVILYYENVGDTTYTMVDMVLISGNNQSGDWTATIPAQSETGIIHYFIWANDTSGNNITSPIVGDYSIQITGPPSIQVTNPVGGEDWTGGSNQQIEFTAFDTEDNAENLTVFLNYSYNGESITVEINQTTGDGSPYVWTVPFLNATDVKINATVIDSDGNKTYDDSPIFTIDSSPPKVVSTNPVNNSTGISIFQPIVIQFNEQMNISSVIVNQTNGTDPGGWNWFWNEDKDTITGIHNSWLRGENIEITVQENYSDDSDPGNVNNTVYVFSFTTETNPTPEIIHTNISGAQELGDAIRINATITDNGTVMNAVLWWQDVDDVWHENYMSKNSDDWEYIIPGQMIEGKVKYQVNATDDLQQKNTTIIYEFDIEDTTLPVIVHTPVESTVINEPINITSEVTDLGGVDVVYLYYKNETNIDFMQIEMNTGFWYEIPAYSTPNTIEYYIQTFDIYGNDASTQLYSLEIIDPSVPDTIPPEVLLATPSGDDIPISTNISIVFSEAVNRTSVEGAITISPTISGISYNWLDNQTLVIEISGNLTYNTTYSITIDTGAKDLAGNTLANDYTWQFSTAGEPEIIQPPASNDLGWIVMILILSVIIALLLFYQFRKEGKEKEIEELE